MISSMNTGTKIINHNVFSFRDRVSPTIGRPRRPHEVALMCVRERMVVRERRSVRVRSLHGSDPRPPVGAVVGITDILPSPEVLLEVRGAAGRLIVSVGAVSVEVADLEDEHKKRPGGGNVSMNCPYAHNHTHARTRPRHRCGPCVVGLVYGVQ